MKTTSGLPLRILRGDKINEFDVAVTAPLPSHSTTWHPNLPHATMLTDTIWHDSTANVTVIDHIIITLRRFRLYTWTYVLMVDDDSSFATLTRTTPSPKPDRQQAIIIPKTTCIAQRLINTTEDQGTMQLERTAGSSTSKCTITLSLKARALSFVLPHISGPSSELRNCGSSCRILLSYGILRRIAPSARPQRAVVAPCSPENTPASSHITRVFY